MPDERPIVGPPPPIIEELNVPRISAAEARRGQEKRAFNDGRKELAVSSEAEELHNLIHSLYKSGGKVDVTVTGRIRGARTTARNESNREEDNGARERRDDRRRRQPPRLGGDCSRGRVARRGPVLGGGSHAAGLGLAAQARRLCGRWVVDGEVVGDDEISGVFVRRSAVYPEEFLSTHPDDRSYLAAEAHAFLVFVLAETRATVANPVADGALGDEAIRPERWISAAGDAGLSVAPLRLTESPPRRTPASTRLSSRWSATRPSGMGRHGRRLAALRIAHELDLLWATVVFDGRHRLLTVTSARPPGDDAVDALGRLLAGPARA